MAICSSSSRERTVFLCVFMVIYLSVGATMFMVMEGPREEQSRTELRLTYNLFLRNNTCVTDDELEDFIREIITANNRGVSAVGNVTSEPNWSFGQSLFFAGTVLTTIGYGHVTPLSEGGKIFCIVYAVIGIPLTLILFTALVERMMILTAKLLTFLNSRLNHLYKSFHIRLIHLSIILVSLIIFIFLIPSALFSVLEKDWNYLDAFYYCFISMTTIGLGDYIPGDSPNQPQRVVYKICTTFYLFIGLMIMMLFLANIYEVPELNIGFHFYMKSDENEASERTRLRSAEDEGPRYTKQVDEAGGATYQGDQTEDQQKLAEAALGTTDE